MSQHTATLFRCECHLHKPIGRVRIQAVEVRQAIVQKQIIRQQQGAIVRSLTPHRLLQEKVQRSAQIADDRRRESRK